MKLLFKQRFFSWLDSYDIYDEAGNTVFTVEGKLGWGHVLHILDRDGRHIGTVRERVLTFFEPKFEIYRGEDEYIGCITKRLPCSSSNLTSILTAGRSTAIFGPGITLSKVRTARR